MIHRLVHCVHFFRLLGTLCLSTLLTAASLASDNNSAGYDIASFQGDKTDLIQQIFPRSTGIAPRNTETGVWEIYQLDQLLGYAFESRDMADLLGFSGKPINLLIGLDGQGRLAGVRILSHAEPIFLHGLGPEPLIEFVNQYQGKHLANRFKFGRKQGGDPADTTEYLDGVTKATVSVMVINDVVLASALTVARARIDAFAQAAASAVDYALFTPMNWDMLIQQSLVRHWTITRSDAEAALGHSLALYPELDGLVDYAQDEQYLDTYSFYVNPPSIGRNILGDAEYERLLAEIKPGEHVIGVMASGFYDILGPNFREGKMPERISLSQHGLAIPMRDMAFFRKGNWQPPAGMPQLDNLLFYRIRPQAGFNPAEPYGLALYFDLARNHLMRDQAVISDTFQLPSRLFLAQPVDATDKPTPLWMQLWQARWLDISVLLLALAGISYLFIRQDRFIKPGAHLARWRLGILGFTTLFIGYYTQGQLSVVNIYTLLLQIKAGFDLQIFLLDPVLFILWSFTFVSLFLFGRGLFCGWLCPFGALQEFAAHIGKRLKIKQIKVPQALDSALRKMKYVILLGLVVSAFLSLDTAEKLAEIEPFKTAITLNFVRYWPFVAYAIGLLLASMFVHKFYCRYVCPLGAGLAILGAFPLFKWLHRRAECGSPCQLCRHQCEIGAIDRTGKIDYLECVQCLECVRIIEDPQACAPAKVALRRQTAADVVRFVEI